MFETALCSDRFPLYERLIWKCLSEQSSGHRYVFFIETETVWTALRMCALRFRKWENSLRKTTENPTNSPRRRLFSTKKDKTINKRKTFIKVIPESSTPDQLAVKSLLLSDVITHSENSSTLHDTTLYNHWIANSGWTADAILYVVRPLRHKVFLDDLHALHNLHETHTLRCSTVSSIMQPKEKRK